MAAADVELLLLIIARVFFSDDNNGAVERKENHLRKSIFGFVADVDMEPCLQWLGRPSGNVPDHNDASASLIIVLAGLLAAGWPLVRF